MFTFDEPRARALLRRIYEAYMNGTYLYQYVHSKNNNAPQQKFIPDGVSRGSQAHLMFLFFANLLTYHAKSDAVFEQIKQVHEKAPEAFSREVAVMPLGFIQKLLVEVGFIYPNSGGKRWYASAGTLFNRYAGNPVAVFSGKRIKSVDDFIEMKRKEGRGFFTGLGPKLFSLLVLFYEEVEAMSYIRGAFPVDIHVQNECMGMGIVTTDLEVVNATLLAEFLRPRIAEICWSEPMSALDLSHAMWFLGSYVCSPLCKRKPRQAEVLCPVYEECAGRVSTKAYSKKGKWNLKNELPLFDHFNL